MTTRPLWIVWFVGAAGGAFFVSELAGGAAGPLSPRNVVIVTVVAVGVYLAMNADPAWLISAGIGLGVFNSNWSHMGFGSVVVPDRMLLGAGLLALLLRIPPQAKDRPPIRARREYWVVAAAALYAVLSAIAVGSIVTNVGFFRLVDRFGLLPFFMFAVAPVAFRTRRQRSILLGTLVVVGAYVGIVTWADAVKVDALVWPKYILDPAVGITQGRGRGPFAAADANGLALLACSVAAVIGFRAWRPRWVKMACVAVALLGLGGTFLTLTRSVWIGTAAAGIVTMLSFRELRAYLLPAAAAMCAGVLISLAAIPGLSQRATDRQHDERPIWDRQNGNAAALRMLADRPLVGFGWDEYFTKNTDYFVQDKNIPLTGYHVPLHDVYLSNAVELGLLGAALWLAALFAAIGGSIFRRGPPELRAWRIGLMAIAVQWAVESALAPVPYAFPNVLLWTWAGIACGLLPEQIRAATLARRPVPGPSFRPAESS